MLLQQVIIVYSYLRLPVVYFMFWGRPIQQMLVQSKVLSLKSKSRLIYQIDPVFHAAF